MNPQQEQNNSPQSSTPTPVETPLSTPTQEQSPKKSHKKLALMLLIGPSALLLLTFVLYAISNFITNSTAPNSGELFTQPSLLTSIINIFLFFIGTISVLAWLPGIIIGIILLNKK